MGMYDNFKFNCPECGQMHMEQTKAGDRTLTTYNQFDAPAAILADFHGYTFTCTYCHSHFELIVQTILSIMPIRDKPEEDNPMKGLAMI